MIEFTRCAMHCITEEPEKIVRAIQRREKKEIDEYNDLIKLRDELSHYNNDNDVNDNENLMRFLEMMNGWYIASSIRETRSPIVIKKWQMMLISVYLIMETDLQRKNGVWVSFGDRPKHITQKYGALMAYEYDSELCCDLYSKGELIKDWNFYANKDMKFGEQDTCISDIGGGKIFQKLLEYAPVHCKENYLAEVPLLLPNDWSEKWHIVKQTQLTYLCE